MTQIKELFLHPWHKTLMVAVWACLAAVHSINVHADSADKAASHAADTAVARPDEGAVPAPPIRQIFDVRSRMRDGVQLSADVWLPRAPGKHPVLLLRTPYLKTMPEAKHAEWGRYFAQRGYAFVVQDVRGRGDSGGEFNFFFQEAQDGYDAVEALAREPWANGRVCMIGVSYWATTQWLAARERPPHLACIAPTSPAGEYLNELPTIGGAFMMMWGLHWLNDTSGRISQGPNMETLDWQRIYEHRPLLTMDEAMGRQMRLYREFLQHPTMDAYWRRIQFTPQDFQRIDIPVLTVTGLFDGDQTGALFYWKGLREHEKTQAENRFLVIGPWSHIQSFLGGADKMGELALSADAIIDNKALHLAFFDRYLKQSTTTLNFPRARVYVTGANEWRNYADYPLREVKTQRLFFASTGKANTAQGDGRLTWGKQEKRSHADEYRYDPKNPVPFSWDSGANRLEIQQRPDVLVYTSDPLQRPLEAIGSVSVELYAASDARDTDFTAVISDVQPDGRALYLGSKPVGIIRARYRDGMDQERLLSPGKVERYTISLGDLAHSFLPGHRVRVEISSSAFPMFNPNQNTGNPIATDTEWRTATQRVFHDAAHPSALVLSVTGD